VIRDDAQDPDGMRRALLGAICAVLSAGATRAEEATPPSVYGPGEMIEVVGRRPQGARAAQAVSVVTAEEIEARGAATLDEAIALLPGVNVRVGGDGVPRVDMRGFRTRHVLLLLDGVPVSSAVDGQFDPRLVAMEDVAAIEVVAGPGSVLYGAGGLGGVLNVVTRRGAGGFGGVVGAEGGDHAPYLVRASASGEAGPIDLLLGGSAARVDAFPLSADFRPTTGQPAGHRRHSAFRRASLLGNVAYAPHGEAELGLTAYYAHASYGKPVSVLGDDADPYAAPPRYDRVPRSELLSLQAAGDQRLAPWLRIRAWAYANRLEEEDERYDDARYATLDERSGSYDQRLRSTALGGAVRPRIDLGAAGAIGALLSAERDAWANRGQVTVGPGAFVPADLDRRVGLYAAALEYEVSPPGGIGLVAGYGRHVQARPGAGSARDFTALAAASWEILAESRVRASCSRDVRFPSLGDLYAPGRGNADLRAERALSCAAGADVLLPGGTSLGANAFRTRAEGLIQTDQATGLATNLSEVRFAGVEVVAAARPARGLTVRGGYAFLHSEDRSREGRQDQQYTPRHRATAEGSFELPFGPSADLSLVYVGSQLYYPRNGSTLGPRRLPDRLVVDARIRQRLLDGRMGVYVGARNLLDQDYETSYGFPQAGRFVYGGIELRL
jgi:vitamin B12 transporter